METATLGLLRRSCCGRTRRGCDHGQESGDSGCRSEGVGTESSRFPERCDGFGQQEKTFEEIGKRFGKLDVVFANAGIPGTTPAGKAEEQLLEEIIQINLSSVFFTVQDALPYLNDGGAVVLNGSVIGTLGQPGYAAYAASKAGVRAMIARSLPADLSPRGIRVNVVAPGATKVPIWGGEM